MSSTTTTWVPVASVDELLDGGTLRVDVPADRGGPARIALVRIGDDVYAIGDRCSHQEASLAEGEVDPDELTLACPKHGAEFGLIGGEALTLPAVRPVPSWEARLVGNMIEVGLGAEDR